MMADGWVADEMRVRYGPHKHFYIAKKDLFLETDPQQGGSAPSANTAIRTVNLTGNEYGETLTVPLDQRLPFQIE